MNSNGGYRNKENDLNSTFDKREYLIRSALNVNK